MLWDRLLLGSIWRQLVRAAVWCPRNLLLYVQKENEAMEELWGGREGGWVWTWKRNSLCVFMGKSVWTSADCPLTDQGPPGQRTALLSIKRRRRVRAHEEGGTNGGRALQRNPRLSPATPQQTCGCVASVSLSQTPTCPSGLGAIKPPGASESWLPASEHPCSSLLFQ